MCEQLLEDTGIAILPGCDFGRPPEELTARLAYVDFDGAQALAASEPIPLHTELDDGFVHNYCERVVTAVDRVCNWAVGD